MSKVKAVYIGQRRFNDSSLSAAFKVDGEKDLRFFRHIRFAEIGREYWLEKKGEHYSSPRMPEAVDEEKTVQESKQLKTWVAEECEDKNAVRRLKKQKASAKNQELASIARRLKGYCQGMTYFEIKSVVEFLIEEASKKSR